ncbi:uncharacterized protein BJ171DRAFT_155205 [Polychytrium aggregatum]|uniref:uncharacterized protein n=1 Tax=Polychytrium aggregatum TaxID=110093 RepID=UPI0022FE29F0|nr:uncharacterized protein BJ171DRAFT_155205 [Polychytrium aggregatum]KAI9203234.1 hypothetical protein BJ171DRAFT_155205 [Polychytrium aggregatum]
MAVNIVAFSADTAGPVLLYPDIFTIVCFNDSFQAALEHSTIKILLQVCRRVRPLLSSKLARLDDWCRVAGLFHPNGKLRISLARSDRIALSLQCKNAGSADRSWLVAQADLGNTAALFFLARVLQVDLNRRRLKRCDREDARKRIFHLLEAAADANHAMAQFHLADRYHHGCGVDQNHIKAFELYRSAAERGIPQAQVALGRRYENGEGVYQDFDAAIEWYSKVSNQGNDDIRLRIVLLRGWFSLIGHGVDQSDVDALSHWQEVSTQPTDPTLKSIATHMVGWMHYLGRGTERDEQKGVKIIRENRSAKFPFGETECLAGSSDTKSRSHLGLRLFELCQFGSDHDWLCKHLMAVCMVRGFGIVEHRNTAVDTFAQLANEGHSDSQFWIGQCFYHGWGVSQDHKKAFEWHSKSANQGNSYGQWMAGVYYLMGKGDTSDETKAVECFRKSAEQGNRCGQYFLGDCYKKASGVDKDIDTAVFWLRKSADQGYTRAINTLKNLGKWP